MLQLMSEPEYWTLGTDRVLVSLFFWRLFDSERSGADIKVAKNRDSNSRQP